MEEGRVSLIAVGLPRFVGAAEPTSYGSGRCLVGCARAGWWWRTREAKEVGWPWFGLLGCSEQRQKEGKEVARILMVLVG